MCARAHELAQQLNETERAKLPFFPFLYVSAFMRVRRYSVYMHLFVHTKGKAGCSCTWWQLDTCQRPVLLVNNVQPADMSKL
jgi:hypothetical protein